MATTLIILSENGKNFLDVSVYSALPSLLKHPSAPPLLLLAYCATVAGWNLSSPEVGRIEEWPTKLSIVAASIVIAITGLVYVRPIRLDFPLLYSLLVIAAMLATLGLCFLMPLLKRNDNSPRHVWMDS